MGRKCKAIELDTELEGIDCFSPLEAPQHRYTYSPLQKGHIRILVLHPGQPDDALYGVLESARLNDRPCYRAISYTWGPPVFPFKLHLDLGVLKITESLYFALGRFRQARKPVSLWADAVCINQGDSEERNAQVAMMGDIYRRAGRTLVWLGEARRSDAAVFWALNFLSDFITLPETRGQGSFPELKRAFESQISRTSGTLECACCHQGLYMRCCDLQSIARLLYTFIKRPWFGRLWVLQEAVLARRVMLYCGSHAIAIEVLACAVGCFHFWSGRGAIREDAAAYERVTKMCDALPGSEGSFQEPSLETLLLNNRDRKALEPRDRVFAVRSLLFEDDMNDANLRPDYSAPLERLWRDVTVHCLRPREGKQFHPASILAIAGLQQPRLNPLLLPTWTPDWSALDDLTVRKFMFYYDMCGGEFSRIPKAGGPSSGFIVMCDPLQPETLRFRSTLLAAITHIIEKSQHPANLLEANNLEGAIFSAQDLVECVEGLLLPWYLRCRKAVVLDDPKSHFVQNEFGPFVQHSIRNVGRREPWESAFEGALRNVFEQASASALSKHGLGIDANQMYEDLRPYLRADAWSYNIDLTQVMATTADGHIAWVPPGTERGDRLCLFAGAPFPFVVRPARDGCYELIGDAYVQGIMYGEAWPQDESQTEVIRLV